MSDQTPSTPDSVDHPGNSSEKIILQQQSEHRQLTEQLIRQANRNLLIFSHDLDPGVYDQAPLIEAIRQLAIRSPMTSVRILLQDNERIQKQGHRILELSRRLSSKIAIHRPVEDYINRPENFALVDSTGYVKRLTHHRYEGEACFNCRMETVRLEHFFNEAWESSSQDSALRRLYL